MLHEMQNKQLQNPYSMLPSMLVQKKPNSEPPNLPETTPYAKMNHKGRGMKKTKKERKKKKKKVSALSLWSSRTV